MAAPPISANVEITNPVYIKVTSVGTWVFLFLKQIRKWLSFGIKSHVHITEALKGKHWQRPNGSFENIPGGPRSSWSSVLISIDVHN